MRDKLFEIFREYSHKKAGYIPIEDRQELVDEIHTLFANSEHPRTRNPWLAKWQRSVLEDETDALEANMDAVRRIRFSEDIAYAGNTYQRTGDEPV